jgi:hypothetical protein
MSDHLGEEVPSATAQAWDSVRRVREPVAWTLLVVTAIAVLVSAWLLFGLPGAGMPGTPPGSDRDSRRIQSARCDDAKDHRNLPRLDH